MIRLFADTASNLHVALNKKYKVNIIPLSYSVDGVDAEYDLEHDFDGKAFYDAMRNGAEMKTSMVNTSAFREKFEDAIKTGDSVVYIGLSGGVSGTVRAAEIAAEELCEEYPEAKIAVIDSLGAGLGIGIHLLIPRHFPHATICPSSSPLRRGFILSMVPIAAVAPEILPPFLR